jgi:hypothetical protein
MATAMKHQVLQKIESFLEPLHGCMSGDARQFVDERGLRDRSLAD